MNITKSHKKHVLSEVQIKMVEQEDSVLNSLHRRTKTTTVYRTTMSENNLKTSRTDFLQLRV